MPETDLPNVYAKGGILMKRRDVLKGMTLAGAAGLSFNTMSMAAAGSAADDGTQTAKAMAELLEMLARKDAGFADRAWHLPTPSDLAEARIMLTHTLHHALGVWLGADPARPVFRRWHYPDKK